MAAQILWGSFVLGLCSFINLFLMIGWIKILRRIGSIPQSRLPLLVLSFIIGSTFAVIVLAHTIQVWIWAFFLVQLGALPGYSDAIYFSLVTYTTVGYGDVTIGPNFRIFGAMASVTGLLGVGISTAFLVGLLTKLFSNHLE